MLQDRLPPFIAAHYECHEWRHASAILSQDFPNEWWDILSVLEAFRLKKSWITQGGGRKSKVSEFIDGALYGRGWVEKDFKTGVYVDGAYNDSPTHSVDCFRNRVALEIEWNNKDPFFDRDLNNFRLLFDLQAVSVGVIITRISGWRATLPWRWTRSARCRWPILQGIRRIYTCGCPMRCCPRG